MSTVRWPGHFVLFRARARERARAAKEQCKNVIFLTFPYPFPSF